MVASQLTIHKLLFLQRCRESLRISLIMQCHNMKARTTIVTFNRKWTRLMLHGKIVPYRP